MVRGLREAAFWMLAALALVLLLALSSFDPSEPSFSYTGEPGRVGNLIGPLGAWVADILFMLFGLPAFLFPVAIAYGAWVAFKHEPGEAPRRSTLALRAVGLVLAIITSCGLATLHFDPGQLQSTAGGVLGSLVGESLAATASFLGATLTDARVSGCKMTGADLSDAKAIGLTLANVLMVLARLPKFDFRKARLDQVDFSEADLRQSDFRDAVFEECSLRDANLADCRFEGADLRGADLGGVKLTDARRFKGAVISKRQAGELLGQLGLKVL